MPYKDPAKNRAARDAYQKSPKGKYSAWKHSLKKNYGITPDDYNQMFSEQEGCCAICGIHQTETKHKLHVDHCHETGAIRGLLCKNCNFALGNFKDSVVNLSSAIKYLELNR